MYEKVGIFDIRKFYENKCAVEKDFDFTKNIISFYDINNFKNLWIYSNVRENTKVLDFGCGSGTLSCLKNKGCEITGIDYSNKALKYAKEINNYDFIYSGDLFEYDFFTTS